MKWGIRSGEGPYVKEWTYEEITGMQKRCGIELICEICDKHMGWNDDPDFEGSSPIIICDKCKEMDHTAYLSFINRTLPKPPSLL